MSQRITILGYALTMLVIFMVKTGLEQVQYTLRILVKLQTEKERANTVGLKYTGAEIILTLNGRRPHMTTMRMMSLLFLIIQVPSSWKYPYNLPDMESINFCYLIQQSTKKMLSLVKLLVLFLVIN